MQWSDRPNASFSAAPPGQLVRPVVADRTFGYGTVNVTAQRNDRVPLGNSVSWCELGFCCGISSAAGTISGCCCRSSTGW